jgi:hypothetical protein
MQQHIAEPSVASFDALFGPLEEGKVVQTPGQPRGHSIWLVALYDDIGGLAAADRVCMSMQFARIGAKEHPIKFIAVLHCGHRLLCLFQIDSKGELSVGLIDRLFDTQTCRVIAKIPQSRLTSGFRDKMMYPLFMGAFVSTETIKWPRHGNYSESRYTRPYDPDWSREVNDLLFEHCPEGAVKGYNNLRLKRANDLREDFDEIGGRIVQRDDGLAPIPFRKLWKAVKTQLLKDGPDADVSTMQRGAAIKQLIQNQSNLVQCARLQFLDRGVTHSFCVRKEFHAALKHLQASVSMRQEIADMIEADLNEHSEDDGGSAGSDNAAAKVGDDTATVVASDSAGAAALAEEEADCDKQLQLMIEGDKALDEECAATMAMDEEGGEG